MATEAITPRSRRPIGRRLLPHRDNWLAYTAVVLGLLVLAAVGAMAYATYTYAQEYEGRFLPGSVVSGVDISGMSRAQARERIHAEMIGERMASPVELTWRGRSWEVTPTDVGATHDLEELLELGLDATASQSWLDFAEQRFLGGVPSIQGDVLFTFDRKQVRSYVGDLARDFRREPRDASLDYSTGWVEIVEEREGRELRVRRATSALLAAFKQGEPEVPLPVKVVKPEVTSKEFDQILLLRIGENKLYLYEDGKITHDWVVATGQPEYPTPTGEYLIELKRYMPTWVNPAPDGWGASMPESIPPGPSNPLGTRALNWNASGIRFHGTQATYSLGHNASHGCVRMAMADIEALYDMVDVGTRIVSIQVGSYDPLYEEGPDLASAEG